jgi:hypothetical protein
LADLVGDVFLLAVFLLAVFLLAVFLLAVFLLAVFLRQAYKLTLIYPDATSAHWEYE